VAILHALNQGLFDGVLLDGIARAQARLRAEVTAELAPLCRRIDSGAALSDDDWQALRDAAVRGIEGDANGESRTTR
jgi:F-type H+-transporting ATPase subunit alpha